MTALEPEIVEATTLCTPSGRLDGRAIGFSRVPLHRCNLGPRGWLRQKRWNYWCVTTDECVFAITLADVGYLTLAVASTFDLATAKWTEKAVVLPLSRGLSFPETVRGGDLRFDRFGLRIAITEESDGTRLVAAFLQRGERVRADILVNRDTESLNVVVPTAPPPLGGVVNTWGRSDRHFQFTSKAVALPASGEIASGAKRYAVGAATRAFACLDFGRGVWPYRTRWQWAAAAGVEHGRTVGVNFGGEWTRGTGMTENGLFVDGRLHKISDDVEVTRAASGAPCRIRTREGASALVDVRVTARHRRDVAMNAGVLASSLHWVLGDFSGRIVTADGFAIELRGLCGWAEDHVARW